MIETGTSELNMLLGAENSGRCGSVALKVYIIDEFDKDRRATVRNRRNFRGRIHILQTHVTG